MSLEDDDVILAGDEALHSALASIPGVSVIVFDHALRIRAVHGNALQRHGYVHEQMVGKPARETMRPPVWERIGPSSCRRSPARRRRSASAPRTHRGLRVDLQPRPARRARGRGDDDLARHHRADGRRDGAVRGQGASAGGPRPQPDGDLHARPRAALDRRQRRDLRDPGQDGRADARPADGRGVPARGLRAARRQRPRGHRERRAAELRRAGRGRARGRGAPHLVAQVPRARRRGLDHRARRRVARRHRARAQRARAGSGARPLRDACSSRRPSAWSSAASTRTARTEVVQCNLAFAEMLGRRRGAARQCRTTEMVHRTTAAAPADDRRRDGGPHRDGRAALRASATGTRSGRSPCRASRSAPTASA